MMKQQQIFATMIASTIGLISVNASAACGNVESELTARPYTLIVTDSSLSQCATVTAQTATAFVDTLTATNLNSLFTGANSASDAISVNASFNSLITNFSFPKASTQLTFSIPELGVNQVFAGATRDASIEQLRDYLKKGNLVGQIMNYQAKNSPFSPISGQNGLIPTTMANDFGNNFTNVATNIAAPAATAKAAVQDGKAGNLLSIGAAFGSGKINDVKASMVTLPLSYTFRNDIDPRRQLVLQLPITYTEVDSAKSVQSGFGVAYRIPMSDNWTLTPGGKYSFVASADLGTVAALYSATLGSTYLIEMPRFNIAIGNMLGIYKTGQFSSGDYSFDPNISTTGMRNGIMLSQPVTVGGSAMSLEYSLIDARYFGDKPFADNSQELAVTLGTNKSAFSARSFIRAGLGYAHSKAADSWQINLGYWF